MGNFHSGSALRERNSRLGRSVCVPALCSTAKVRNFVAEFLASADLILTNDYDQSMFCRTNEPQPLETLDIIAMWVCVCGHNFSILKNYNLLFRRVVVSILLLLLLSSTLYEISMIHRNGMYLSFACLFPSLENAFKCWSVNNLQNARMSFYPPFQSTRMARNCSICGE